MIEFSVVIPVRNGEATLKACLEALGQQTVAPSRFEVIVVDDGSDDATGRIAQGSQARLISQPTLGAAAARNRGLSESTGQTVLFLDADCLPRNDWMERMVGPFADDSLAGTVGQFVSNQAGWVARMIQIELDNRYARMSHYRETDFVNTATCAFRREKLGPRPFDESFAKLEDLELSFRLAASGVRMLYVPEAIVEHQHPESLAHHMKRRYLYGRYTPLLYRRYSGKLVSDRSTPHSRRLQLVSLALAPAGFLTAWWVGVGLLGLSLLMAAPTLGKAFRRSFLLGLCAPLFVTAGNLAFVAGSLIGLVAAGMQSRRVSRRPEPAGSPKEAGTGQGPAR